MMLPVNCWTAAAAAAMMLAVTAAAARPPATPAVVTPGVVTPGVAAPASAASAPAGGATLSHGRFSDFPVYSPSGTPKSFVLLLSGNEGWNALADTLARQLVHQGAMVTGIDLPKYKKSLEAAGDQCVFPDGDLENLSHFVQAYEHLPSYLPPILVGVSSGATLAYASLAQAPRDTFASALTVNFCPAFDLVKPLCKGSGLEFTPAASGHGVEFLPVKSLGNPWVTLQGNPSRACEVESSAGFVGKILGAAAVPVPGVKNSLMPTAKWMPQFDAAFGSLAARVSAARIAPAPAALGNLPVVEVPPQPGSPAGDTFAILMSGDGGWAGLDQDVAAALAAKGIPVVGLDSLRYYWTARTPDGLAADTDRLIRYYLEHLGKKRVLLIGYSQGADVLPFAVNRLPPATRAKVALAAVMGMSEHALFEFHVTSWVSDDNSGPATMPEVNRITGMPVLCIYGEDEKDSLCPKLDPAKVQIVKLKGGHHFDGDYANLARQILAAANR